MKHKITLLFCLISLATHAQTFQDFIMNGSKLYSQGKYLESGKEYDNAFEKRDGDRYYYYNAACSWSLAGDTSQAIKYLNLSIDHGYKDIAYLKKDKDFSMLHPIEEWTDLLEKLQANIDEYEKDFDIPLKEQLEYILAKDQFFRVMKPTVQKKFDKESGQRKYFNQKWSEQDSLNLLEVIEIIDKRGWVGINLVGEKGNKALFYVIQHSMDLEIQEKYLPLLKESALKGESELKDVALLEDRVNILRGRPQVYGTQFKYNQETGKHMFYEIFEPEYVNQRRKEVDLYPIEDDAKRLGIEWNIDQKDK